MSNLSVLQQNTLLGLTVPGSHRLYLEACDRVGEFRAFWLADEWQDRFDAVMAAAFRHGERHFASASAAALNDVADFIAVRFLNHAYPPKGNRQ